MDEQKLTEVTKYIQVSKERDHRVRWQHFLSLN